jgi:hypothetical protein
MAPKAVAKAALKAKGKAKAHAKARAAAKEQDKEPCEVPDVEAGKSSKGHAKGWKDIEAGKTFMGKLGAMAVMDQLKSLAKKGNTAPLENYKTLKPADKMEFALQLKLDREASFMSVTENHSMETSITQNSSKGWLTNAQIARDLGLINYTTCELQAKELAEVLEGLPSMPHDRPDLAAKGWKLYHYSTKRLTEYPQKTTDSMKTECTAQLKTGQEHDSLMGMLQNTDNSNNQAHPL